jgi:hypothetical protein
VSQPSLQEQILAHYRTLVANKHADKLRFWPVLCGYDSKVGQFGSCIIVFFEHTARPGVIHSSGVGQIPEGLIGFDKITDQNKATVRANLERHFHAKTTDAVFIVDPASPIEAELWAMLERHEFAMGLVPMKIFLSHKGADKPLVREYKQTLQLLGFDPWLDEDAMHAGVELERGILKGFKDSCAAVFFITPSFKDEKFLASEVNYAISEKRSKGDRFAIITIVFGAGGVVPDLLRTYVWKEPKGDLEALREIVRALPVRVGTVYWK